MLNCRSNRRRELAEAMSKYYQTRPQQLYQGLTCNGRRWLYWLHHQDLKKAATKNLLIHIVVKQICFCLFYRGHHVVFILTIKQGDSFGTKHKKMRISQRLFVRFWTCIYDYIPCFMRSMSILVCRSLTSWRHQDNDWRLAPCRAQPCHCVVR